MRYLTNEEFEKIIKESEGHGEVSILQSYSFFTTINQRNIAFDSIVRKNKAYMLLRSRRAFRDLTREQKILAYNNAIRNKHFYTIMRDSFFYNHLTDDQMVSFRYDLEFEQLSKEQQDKIIESR